MKNASKPPRKPPAAAPAIDSSQTAPVAITAAKIAREKVLSALKEALGGHVMDGSLGVKEAKDLFRAVSDRSGQM